MVMTSMASTFAEGIMPASSELRLINQNVEWIASPGEFTRSRLLYAMLSGIYCAKSNYKLVRDFYPACEVIHVVSGKGWYLKGKEWIEICEGDSVIQDLRYPNGYKAHAEEPFVLKYVVFDGMPLVELWNLYFTDRTIIMTSPALKHSLLPCMDAIIALMQEPEPTVEQDYEISKLLYELLLQALAYRRGKGGEASGEVYPAALQLAKQYMDESLASIRDIREVANRSGLSYFHFNRTFKRYFQCTPREYLLLNRINHAKQLLLLSRHSITEIAYRSGFDSYSTFLQSFQKVERCSPTAYRKNWRQD
ncbi:helix-turn-helix domain-containing protein [Paenibacillus sp. CF384]|uniref:helix-turn-helix domain-containing protein n=1 Tax=Paenibacillus sp. CF384 TaxID=1884382 RepID=UPI0008971387|nr:helix-turn-helix domain-containing protein [Paenibacillus sp. CF384]SDX46295.1 AraC-type DNA-binding protein [Paenibacillus sp. CF384]